MHDGTSISFDKFQQKQVGYLGQELTALERSLLGGVGTNLIVIRFITRSLMLGGMSL
jgi:hypothetical protein